MKLFLLVLLVLSVSCEKPKPFVRKYTLSETGYIGTLDLESKIIMDDCLKEKYYSVADCIKKLHAVKNPPAVVHEDSGSSIINTAAGMALGYGAVNMLTGSSRPRSYNSGYRRSRSYSNSSSRSFGSRRSFSSRRR
jgi:hypothetical protein